MIDSRAVWKFELPITEQPTEPARIELPRGAEIRKVAACSMGRRGGLCGFTGR